jgi:hypothetical protein
MPLPSGFLAGGFLFFEIKMRNYGSLYILGMTSQGAGNDFRISKK